ncbi:MAG: signal peptidase I [Oscillospiraceae bacterium]|nr:signal peptidase I [Oscillospiraceae bacterium]
MVKKTDKRDPDGLYSSEGSREFIEDLFARGNVEAVDDGSVAAGISSIESTGEAADEIHDDAANENTDCSGDGNSTDAEGTDGEKQKTPVRVHLEIFDWVQCLVSALLAVIMAFIFIGRQITVEGNSMKQTLLNTDRVLMTGVLYTPKYGDIVIIKASSFGEVPLVKRVIATEGQEINIDFAAHRVLVNGVELDEPYINEPTAEPQDFRGPVIVPEGCVFVMGDNRNQSTDSRSARVGFVDTRNILGKVHVITVPGRDEHGMRDWGRIGSVYRTTP